jgi:hypothetical protein
MLRAVPITATSSRIFNDDVAVGSVRLIRLRFSNGRVTFLARDLEGEEKAFTDMDSACAWLVVTPEQAEGPGTRFSLIEVE